ncbi:hypothetical protein SO802_029747 [Lithocarpus litseifolius]|uniref:RNase H type-1 domain-containing protein n=1 Tax=Lithocarpus litseifolius TaxID=425828 RepID=A0AAW2BW76_9ROSI
MDRLKRSGSEVDQQRGSKADRRLGMAGGSVTSSFSGNDIEDESGRRRDCKGQVIAALCKYLQGRFPAKQVEVVAMEQGVLLVQEMQLSRVFLEGDALAVIQAINDNSTGSDLGHIFQGIQQARETIEFYTFKHLNKDHNVATHELSQFARRNEITCHWKGLTPPAVSLLIQSDML